MGLFPNDLGDPFSGDGLINYCCCLVKLVFSLPDGHSSSASILSLKSSHFDEKWVRLSQNLLALHVLLLSNLLLRCLWKIALKLLSWHQEPF